MNLLFSHLPRTLALVALATACSSSQPKPAQIEAPASIANESPSILPSNPTIALPLDPKIRTGVLDNGLTYFIRENQMPEDRAEFWLVVNAGSLHEDEDQLGLAHFVEHMAFNGTKSFPKNELLSKLQSLGVSFGPHINAETNFDETVYKLRVPTDDPEAIAMTLQILSEWADGITFLPEDIDAERGVVLSEERSKQGAEMRMLETLIQSLFRGSQYPKRLPIGKPEIIKSASAATIKRFYKDWYHPSNMAVMVVGDIDADQIEASLKKQFASLATVKEPRAQPTRSIPKRDKPLILAIHDKELPVSAVIVGRLMAKRPLVTMDDFRRDFIQTMAAEMLSKRLEEAQKSGQARYLMAGGGPTELVRAADGLGFIAVVKPSEMRAGLEDLLAELERARRHGFVTTEFDRAKREVIAAMETFAKEAAANKESSTSLVEELVRHFLSQEGIPGRAIELALIRHFADTVKIDEFRSVMEELLSADDLAVASIAPDGASVLSQDDVLAVVSELPRKQLVAYADTASDEPLLRSLPAPGTIASEKHHRAIGVDEWTLSNGAHIVLKPTTFKEDQVLLYAGSPGGTSLSSLEDYKQTFVASSVVKLGGLGSLDSTGLEKALAGRNVHITPFITDYEEGVVASSRVADLETMMQLVHMSFLAPRKDQRAFEIWKNSKKEEVRLSYNQPETRFTRAMLPLQTNNDPRVFPWTEELVDGISLERSFSSYKDRLADASDFTFVFVGSFTLATIKPLVLQYIGSLPDIDRTETYVLDSWPTHTKKNRLVVHDGTSERAQLSLFYRRATNPQTISAKKRAAFKLFGAALELQFLEIFREQLGDTYNVNVQAAFSNQWSRAELYVGLQSEPGRAAELEKRLLAEVNKAIAQGVPSTYLDKARQAAIKNLEINLKRNAYWRDRLFETFFNDRSLDEITDLKRVYEELTETEIKHAAKAFIDPTKPIIGILLPRKS